MWASAASRPPAPLSPPCDSLPRLLSPTVRGQSGEGTEIRLVLTPAQRAAVIRSGSQPACGCQLLNGCLGSPRGGRWGGRGAGWPFPSRASFLLALPFPKAASGRCPGPGRACISRYSLACGSPSSPSCLVPHCSCCGSSPSGRTDLPRKGDRAGVRMEGWGREGALLAAGLPPDEQEGQAGLHRRGGGNVEQEQSLPGFFQDPLCDLGQLPKCC